VGWEGPFSLLEGGVRRWGFLGEGCVRGEDVAQEGVVVRNQGEGFCKFGLGVGVVVEGYWGLCGGF